MKVIFLDIDGVLQPLSSEKRFKHDIDGLKELFASKNPTFEKIDKYDIAAVFYDWHPAAVENLRRLIKKTDAKIVLSSAWRRFSILKRFKALMSIYDLDEYLIDFIPEIDLVPMNRFIEIAVYLSWRKDITHFVILDDVSSGLTRYFEPYYVDTTDERSYYFNDKFLEKAEEILSKPAVLNITEEEQKEIPKLVWRSEETMANNMYFGGSKIVVFHHENKDIYTIHRFCDNDRSFYYRRIADETKNLEEALNLAKKAVNQEYRYC